MSPFQPGDLIGGRYRLMRIIGAGAMGTVWSARNESTDRDFALKLMLPDAAKNPVALQRFFQEAKASGRLRHRSIVEVYDLGRIEHSPNDPRAGTPYLVMELLEGEPLDSVLRRRKTMKIGTALRLVRDVARALDVAHKQRIVHRDLKPANIYLHKTLEGTIVPKILDFGISKLVGPTNFDAVATSIGTVLGSPAYMSPEQAAGETDVDGRSDVWSLGVILYKCLCGTVPFSAANYNALMMAIARNTHPPLGERVPGLPPAVETLVDKCLSKEREGRLESAKLLADELDAVLKAHADLPFEELTEIVTAPIELPPDEARTIATIAAERSQAGTLIATEVGDGASTPPSQSAPINPSSSTTRQLRDAAVPSFRTPVPKRVRVIAGVAGIAALLGTVVFMSTRKSDEPAPPAAPPALAAPVAEPAKAAPAVAPAPSSTPSPTHVAEPSPPPSTTTTATTTASTQHAPTVAAGKPHATTAPKIATKPQKPAAPKPAHEGVTSSGF